ncbi:flagellar basal-body rod protein FlgB [Thermosulfidibacter takaii ABI70S6]|uniref:Flagellar basal body rod protein FlgB n=1 Tax=Thermosulfidibacter takaii (strain DSM 17441 / JCM 13301 / NBRC 103674 / ABI70S6) TaxID=1298851 RepID=A0A0S3QSX2_THET7|nr:flagellar basal body rod protein FlgB [Thermosulfidibacter takaii]BAT71432.1 flagellar basal-body rod protein FlgB [Thermosulfidibacter takaii ABI70S6]
MIEIIFDRAALNITSKAMELLRKRHEFIASNIANADTPGYKAKRFSFEKQLQDAVYRTGLHLEVTHPLHISDIPVSLEEVKGDIFEERVPLRNDLNSVDIDKEMALLAQNQLKYDALAQAYYLQVAKLKYAITGR